MRETKFRYSLRLKDTKRYCEWYFTLEEIEQEGFTELFDDRYKLLGKDQYTGLKDKNGKEIYEGDIVDFVWNNGFGGIFYERGIVQCNPPTFDFLVGKETWRWIESNIEVKVIGNIYKNPELLKEEKCQE